MPADHDLYAALFVASVGALAFTGCFQGQREFLEYDDTVNFLHVHEWHNGTAEEQVNWALTSTRGFVYEPVAWLFKSVQYHFFGMSAAGFVSVSAVLHVMTSLVLCGATTQLLSSAAFSKSAPSKTATAVGAALSAAWWCVHPLRAEAVAWVSAQPYCLCGLFLRSVTPPLPNAAWLCH